MDKEPHLTAQTLSERFNVTDRTIQKKANKLKIQKHKGKYLFTESDAKKIENDLTTESEPTDKEEDGITEFFTHKEYRLFENQLKEHSVLTAEKKHLQEQIKHLETQLDYLRKSLDRKHTETEKILSTFEKMIQIQSESNHLQYLDKTKDD